MWNPFKSKPNGPSITFLPINKTVWIEPSTSVLEAALENKIDLNHACDGNLACATCHIYIRQGEETLTPSSADEDNMLDSANNPLPCSRLACQVKPTQNITVEIPL
ncbi:MAG: 2Fe-2S iron-sulfur cluster-binding protein [Mariprofundaceae bacterium]